MRLRQSAQLVWVGQQAQLQPVQGCGACANPCSVGAAAVIPVTTTPGETETLATLDVSPDSPMVDQPVAVTVELESAALNRYVVLVFGLPLAALFALAAVGRSITISAPVQVPFFLLIVASMLLIVTALCRTVARRFESKLQLEIHR